MFLDPVQRTASVTTPSEKYLIPPKDKKSKSTVDIEFL